jgi:anti-anti-sigma factor
MSSDSRPEITTADGGGGVAVISLAGEHDLATAGDLRALLREKLGNGSSVVVRLDLATFIDSTILGGLRRARDAGRGFAVVIGRGDGAVSVNTTLEVSGLMRIFPVFADEEAAIASARANEIRTLLDRA